MSKATKIVISTVGLSAAVAVVMMLALLLG
jgi:hypothetical protein